MEKPLGRMIKMLDEALARRMNSNLQAQNLTAMQSHVLVALCRAEGRTLSLKELEKLFQLAQSTMAGLAVRLEKKGLVRSVVDENDRRVKKISLTEAGHAVCLAGREHIDATERLLVSGLTEEEAETFRSLLEKVYAAVR